MNALRGLPGFVLTALMIVLAPLTAGRAQNETGQPGHWSGQWTETRGSQGGTLSVTIAPDGEMSGVITNSGLSGSWSGHLQPDGQLTAQYLYPNAPMGQPSMAVGPWGLDQAGQIVAHVVFLFQGQPIGEGNLQLARLPDAAVPPGLDARTTPPAGWYPEALAAYLANQPGGAALLGQYGLPNVNDYRSNPSGYIQSLVPAYGAVVGGALDDIRRHSGGSGGSVGLNPIQNTIGMVNQMMGDAMRLSPEEAARKYGGMNALAGAIAEQNRVYTQVYENMLANQARDAQSQAAMVEMEAQMAEWRAAWSVWQSQLERYSGR